MTRRTRSISINCSSEYIKGIYAETDSYTQISPANSLAILNSKTTTIAVSAPGKALSAASAGKEFLLKDFINNFSIISLNMAFIPKKGKPDLTAVSANPITVYLAHSRYSSSQHGFLPLVKCSQDIVIPANQSNYNYVFNTPIEFTPTTEYSRYRIFLVIDSSNVFNKRAPGAGFQISMEYYGA